MLVLKPKKAHLKLFLPKPKLQDKTVTPTEAQQVITADSGYDALGTVTIAAVRLTPKIIRVD